jgi:Fic family protein
MAQQNPKDCKPLIEPLTKAVKDRGENPALMEPMLLSSDNPHQRELTDLALELATASAAFRNSIPPAFVQALAILVRTMNCYYSNLIEGHDTHPVDIERALKKDYSNDPCTRHLQKEAEAHIAVQAWIDSGGISHRALTIEGILEVHKRFYDLLPEELLWVDDPKSGERVKVIPGELRKRDVQIGRHVAISPGSLMRFLQRFESAYSQLGKSERIIATAASHHRLLWMHPFLDGDGRVARLVSYAVFWELLDTGGVWSIARGLARKQHEYKEHLMECDGARHGDLDGRGALSEQALASFSKFFLQTCVDQVKFMRTLVRPDLLRERVLIWAKEEAALGNLPPRAASVLETLLSLGTLPRGEVQSILNSSPASARRVISALTQLGVLTSESTRAPVRLAFPAKLAGRWLPGLFPEK